MSYATLSELRATHGVPDNGTLAGMFSRETMSLDGDAARFEYVGEYLTKRALLERGSGCMYYSAQIANAPTRDHSMLSWRGEFVVEKRMLNDPLSAVTRALRSEYDALRERLARSTHRRRFRERVWEELVAAALHPSRAHAQWEALELFNA